MADIYPYSLKTLDFSTAGNHALYHENLQFSGVRQSQFIEYYEELKATAGEEPILFIDAVHPTQATKISYGWIRRGQKKAVKTTGSRTRLNIMGALNLNAPVHLLICEYKTINEYNIPCFFNEILRSYPDYSQQIHITLDGAGYHRSQRVKDWAANREYKAPLPSALQSESESDRANVEVNERACPE